MKLLKKVISKLILTMFLLFVLVILAMIVSITENPVLASVSQVSFWSLSLMGFTYILLPDKKVKLKTRKS